MLLYQTYPDLKYSAPKTSKWGFKCQINPVTIDTLLKCSGFGWSRRVSASPLMEKIIFNWSASSPLTHLCGFRVPQSKVPLLLSLPNLVWRLPARTNDSFSPTDCILVTWACVFYCNLLDNDPKSWFAISTQPGVTHYLEERSLHVHAGFCQMWY